MELNKAERACKLLEQIAEHKKQLDKLGFDLSIYKDPEPSYPPRLEICFPEVQSYPNYCWAIKDITKEELAKVNELFYDLRAPKIKSDLAELERQLEAL